MIFLVIFVLLFILQIADDAVASLLHPFRKISTAHDHCEVTRTKMLIYK